MKHVFQFYMLEILVVVGGLAVISGAYIVFGRVLRVDKDQLAYVSVASTGLLFIVGHVYSRLKDRRDGRRKRAQDLFLEWHSKEIRESRIFASRWIEVHGKENLPSLGVLEKEAAAAYRRRYDKALVVAMSTGGPVENPSPHALDDPELKEFHFFKIYQFFERWAQLINSSDIDHRVASCYMSSYKNWYLNDFILPWAKIETDEYIKPRLEDILSRVTPNR